jgi:hypothetical protein
MYQVTNEAFTLTVGYQSKKTDAINPSLEYDSKIKSWDFSDITELSN